LAITFLRTVILYLFVIIGMRVMGKRQIGEMQPSEFVAAIMVSELACIPVQETSIPLLSGIIPIFTLIIMEVLLSYISLKSKKFRDIITGKPSVIIHNGNVLREEMSKIRFNYDDLKEQLRLQGYDSTDGIKYAILETNGQLSVIDDDNRQKEHTKDNKKKNKYNNGGKK